MSSVREGARLRAEAEVLRPPGGTASPAIQHSPVAVRVHIGQFGIALSVALIGPIERQIGG